MFWATIMAVGISTAVYMINANIEDTASQPIMTTIDTIDVSEVPFPAVTVLPGEYPTIQYGLDGFSKRLFDYVEFERYKKEDILRFLM